MVPRLPVRMTASFLLLAVIFAIGTAWYTWVEEFGFLDGLYMAVITLTTVGYEEIQPLDTGGRIFTIGYVLVGIGVLFYVATTIVGELVVSGVVDTFGARRRNRRAERMHDHVVIAGQGRVGREVLRVLRERGTPVLAVDANEDHLVFAEEHGAVPLLGDATLEETLRRAHVERARTLVAAADSDAVNTFIVLMARSMNPDLLIIARAASEGADRRLAAAGANRTISPYQIAGRRMAVAAVQPLVLDFIDTIAEGEGRPASGRLLAELEVGEDGAGMAGSTVASVFGASAVRLVAIVHEDGELTVAPSGGMVLRAGDRLLLHGVEADVEQLASAHAGGEARPAAARAAAR